MRNKKWIAVFALVIAFALVAVGCVSKTAETVEVGNEKVQTLYSVVGQRNITGSSKSTGTDGSKVEITYGGGGVAIGDVNEYISKLVNEDGFLVTKDASNDGTGQSYQIGKQVGEEGKVMLIDFYFVDGGDTVITYTVTQGTVTPS